MYQTITGHFDGSVITHINPDDHDIWMRFGGNTAIVVNVHEAEKLATELKALIEWTRKNPKRDDTGPVYAKELEQVA